jgi:lysophospholipid acyltransferase (LPLAT)-like uncharacterized protein
MAESRGGSMEWRRQRAYDLLKLAAPPARWLIGGIGRSVRFTTSGEGPVLELIERKQPYLVAFFHGRQFLLVQYFRGLPITIMTSISYMGELQTKVLEGFGYTVVRGSSSRGGAKVLAQIMKNVKKGAIGAFAVDGPRGPHQEVKPGVIFLARKLGVPIVPVSSSSSPSKLLSSAWDQYIFPFPFSRGHVAFGEPYIPGQDGRELSEAEECRKLAGVLAGLDLEADRAVGRI